MTQLILPIRPEEATKELLKKLPARRMRDVLEKRFGLKGGKKKTLEAIGKEYKITRERVRQIETEALKQLNRPENQKEIEPVFAALEGHVKQHGEVVAEHHLFESLQSPRYGAHVAFLLNVGKAFFEFPETAAFHRRWTVNKASVSTVEKILEKTAEDLEETRRPVSAEDLHRLISKHAVTIAGEDLPDRVRDAYLHTAKTIKENPYGEFGLAQWTTINPRGVKDKAYLVLAKAGKPMHFREVAEAINRMKWSKRKAHPQTVHNELIKDSRFVLVGRGLYGLRDWGYEPGTVRDILVSVLKRAGKPLSRDEVIRQVLEKRFVKPPTILLNLQDRSLFRKADDERYTLA